MNQALVERLRFDADRDGVTTDVHHNLLDAADEIDRLSLALFQIKTLINAASNDGKSEAVKESNANQAWHVADDALSGKRKTLSRKELDEAAAEASRHIAPCGHNELGNVFDAVIAAFRSVGLEIELENAP